jgi:predicted metal-dependent peptidase
MSLMAWTAPGFRHLFYKLLCEEHNGGRSKYAAVMTRDVPIAATDGYNILINPDTFFKFKPLQRVYIVAHEVEHNMYDDVTFLAACIASGTVPTPDGKTLPFDEETMQIAMDARINSSLDSSKIGQRPDTLDGKPCGHSDDSVTPDTSVIDVYREYYEEKDADGQQRAPFDQVLKPGAAGGKPQAQPQRRNAQQWAVEVQVAQQLEEMRTQGDLPAELRRLFHKVLEPEVYWLDHIVTEINRTVGDGGYDWKRPDPWYAVLDSYSPAPASVGAGMIVVWGDTSGSRSDAEVASSIAELSGILSDVNPRRLVVLWCDAQIDHVDEISDPVDLQRIVVRGTSGGGGTSLEPVWEWIKENTMGDVDLFIGFTDGYVEFPKKAPQFPVIWASSTEDIKYPFGKVVRVNKQAGRA